MISRLHCCLFAALLAIGCVGIGPASAAAADPKAAEKTVEDTSGWNAERWNAEGWKRKADRDFQGALEAFAAALKAGGDGQVLAMEMGYVYTQIGQIEAARAQFETAKRGANERLQEQAELELSNLGRSSRAVGTVAHAAMVKGYAYCETEEWALAIEAFEEARVGGWDAQAIDLQLGYVEIQRERLDAARMAFKAAQEGANPSLSEQAAGALAALPPGLAELSESDLKLAEARRLRDERRWEEAMVAYKQAMDVGADPQHAHFEMGRMALELRTLRPTVRAAEKKARLEEAAAAKAAREAARLAAQKAAEAHEVEPDAEDMVPEEPPLTEEEEAALLEEAIREEQRREFAQRFLNQAYVMKRGGDYDGAVAAFRFARDAGADAQGIAMEIGFVELERGNKDMARRHFLEATAGPDKTVVSLAAAQLHYLPPPDPEQWSGHHWMIEAYRLKREGLIEDAEKAFATAADRGADERKVALELAVIAETRGDHEAAKEYYASIVRSEEADEYEIRGRRGLATTDPRVREDWTGDHWIAEAHFLTGVGDYPGAVRALELGRGAPEADEEIIAEYRAAVEDAHKWTTAAREHLGEARKGRDTELGETAHADLGALPPNGRKAWGANQWLSNARLLRSLGDLDGSREAYEFAREQGADEQVVDLEMGYLELAAGNIRAARKHFRDAKQGEDAIHATAARDQLQMMPRLFWGDVYADLFGYSRVAPQPINNLIGFLRVRGFVRPISWLDLEPYIFLQISRDVSSRVEFSDGGVLTSSDILNDNALLVGGGILFRFWRQQVGVYAQIALALKLIRDGRTPVTWDLRIGAYVGPSAPTCNPEPQPGGARLELLACAEFYGDVTYVSRFNHNVFFFARGRFGATWLVTGPVAWQPLVEGRFIKDIRNDYWNNIADVGLQHRWRLLKPIGLDLILGVHTGRHLGLAHEDANGVIENRVPDPAGYLDLRMLLATYFIF
jgi:hypothetical protein